MYRVRKSSDVTPYQPRFQDGWSPGVIHFTDEHQNLAKKKSSDSSGHKRKGSNISDISNLTYSSDNDNVFKRSSGASYNGSIISTFDDFRFAALFLFFITISQKLFILQG